MWPSENEVIESVRRRERDENDKERERPVNRDDARNPSKHEFAKSDWLVVRDVDHDEAADHKEQIDAYGPEMGRRHGVRRRNLKCGMINYDQGGCDEAQDLNAFDRVWGLAYRVALGTHTRPND